VCWRLFTAAQCLLCRLFLLLCSSDLSSPLVCRERNMRSDEVNPWWSRVRALMAGSIEAERNYCRPWGSAVTNQHRWVWWLQREGSSCVLLYRLYTYNPVLFYRGAFLKIGPTFSFLKPHLSSPMQNGVYIIFYVYFLSCFKVVILWHFIGYDVIESFFYVSVGYLLFSMYCLFCVGYDVILNLCLLLYVCCEAPCSNGFERHYRKKCILLYNIHLINIS